MAAEWHALGIAAESLRRALLVTDAAGKVLWRARECSAFEAALGPGGPLDPATWASRAPGSGTVLLGDGRTTRWTARRLDEATSGRIPPDARGRILWSYEDTTVERHLRNALEEAEGRLRLMSAHIQGILFELNSDGRFVRVWTSDPNLLAQPEQALLGRTVLETLGPDIGRRHHEATQTTLETGRSVHYEYELDVPGGHRYFASEGVAFPAPCPGKRHAVFWIRDVTEQVQLQRHLVETQRLASVGTLAAGVAHEINNPLAYIMLNAERLRAAFDELSSDPAMRDRVHSVSASVSLIYEGALRVQRIVRDLLQLAKPSGSPEPVDVRQVLALSLELTRSSWEDHADVRIDWNDDPFVLAHHGCLVQVFTNLITNAAEAIPRASPAGDGRDEGGNDNRITIAIRRVDGMLQIEFRDTGSGIPAAHLQRVFEPFFTTKEHGTGLGLAICHTIVTSFNGEIRAEQGHPRGSVFRVRLPASDKPQEEGKTTKETPMTDLDLTTIPNAGRVYDYLLGGQHHFEPDRRAAEYMLTLVPSTRKWIRMLREFQHRAVLQLGREGFNRFLDLASGLPTEEHIHSTLPGARVVYVDNDPTVIAYGTQILGEHLTARYLRADIRRIESVIHSPTVADVLGNEQPLAIGFNAVTCFLEDDEIRQIVRRLYEWAPAGSKMVASFETKDEQAMTPPMQQFVEMFDRMGSPYHFVTLEKSIDLTKPWRADARGFRPLAEILARPSAILAEDREGVGLEFYGVILEKS